MMHMQMLQGVTQVNYTDLNDSNRRFKSHYTHYEGTLPTNKVKICHTIET